MPENPQPTVGRIVHYVLNEAEAELLRAAHEPAIGRTLNTPRAGQPYPAMVTAVFGPATVNLVVRLDGAAEWWATSRLLADDEHTAGRWHWPPRV